MCGIVGYVGTNKAKAVVIKGLERLEYRGYDSAGIATFDATVNVYKEVGRIANLKENAKMDEEATLAIGHTRWATHGKPSKVNSHPHQSESKRFTIVHNGVVDNYSILKSELRAKFLSETDTEVIAHLLEEKAKDGKDTLEAIYETIECLHGSFALGIIDANRPNTIFAVKNKSPLLLGKGEGFGILGSDALAMIDETNEFYELEDGDVAVITPESTTIYNNRIQVQRNVFVAKIDAADAEKGIYEHYMLKEIDEQGPVVRRLIDIYCDESNHDFAKIAKHVKHHDRIFILAAGTSYHAGLVGKYYLENIAGIPTEVHIASEFVYNMPLVTGKPIFIFISQSGETADLRACLVEIKKHKWDVLTITNVQGSTLSREADYTLLLNAGPEIAVASTKAYVAQLTLLALLATKIKGSMDQIEVDLGKVATAIDNVAAMKHHIQELAIKMTDGVRNCFFIGRTVDSLVAYEAALKLKEISYIQTEGFASGELKHGTIALIEDGVPVFAIITQSKIAQNTRSNIEEVKARGANVATIVTEDLAVEGDDFVINSVPELYAPIVSIVPAQLISYYASLHRNLDIDKPRNLAKSVTVE